MFNRNRLKEPQEREVSPNVLDIFTRNGPRRPPRPLRVRICQIGRNAAGKTSILTAISDRVIDEPFPVSGLTPGYIDPLVANEERRKREQRLEIARKTGVPQTLERSTVQFELMEGTRPVLQISIVDEVGEYFTNISSASSPEDQERIQRVLEELCNGDVLLLVIACPPLDPTPRQGAQYRSDLRNLQDWLRAVVRRRSNGRPLAVAIVMTKCDRLADSPDEAQERMSDEALALTLTPLVNLCRGDKKVGDVAIFPTSAFGFGNSIAGDDEDDEFAKSDRSSGTGDLGPGDPPDLPRDTFQIRPFNLQALLAWSLMNGLKQQDVEVNGKETPEAVRIAQLLGIDLKQIESWIVRVKN